MTAPPRFPRLLISAATRQAVASRLRTVGLLLAAFGCALPRGDTIPGTAGRNVEMFLNWSFAVICAGLLVRLFRPSTRWAVDICWVATGLWVARAAYFVFGWQHFRTVWAYVSSAALSLGFAVLSLVVWWVEGEPYLHRSQRRRL